MSAPHGSSGSSGGQSSNVRLPLWCRALVQMASALVPVARRDDWRREWAAELTCFVGGKGAERPTRSRLLSRASICFTDARQVRRLSRRRASGVSSSPRRGPLWGGFEPLRGIRRAARGLAGNPVFSAAAIITLALGIGANTAIFSLVNAVALKPPAVTDSDRLVRIYTSTPEGQPYGSSSYFELQELAEQTEMFDGVVGYTLTVGAMVEDGAIEALLGEVVTGNYFRVLGVPIALGRGFNAEEDTTPGTHPVIVLGHGFWTRRFGADPSIVGSTIKLNGVRVDVIGVAAEDYLGLVPGLAAEFWAPAMMSGTFLPDSPGALTSRESRQFMVHARLRDSAGVPEAQGAVSLVAGRLAEAFPESNEGRTMTVLLADSVRFHPRVDAVIIPVAMLMLSVPALVLLIACTNLAGLLLARATDRRKEIAVRLALGAGRRQVVSQLLGESLMLSVLGGVFGVALASWLLRIIVGFKPPLLVSLSLDVGIDHRVLVFTLAVSVFAGLTFGLLPALRSSKPDLTRALKDEGAMVWRSRRLSLRGALIVGQVAISTFLLLVAGLFVRSLQSAQSVDVGFDTKSSVVLTMNASLRYDEANGREYYRQAMERMAQLPGATAVALADQLPLFGFDLQKMQIIPEAAWRTGDAPGAGESEAISFGRVTPGFFRALGIDLVAGRDFGREDQPGSRRVVIISEAAARHFWGDENPVGKHLRTLGGQALQVVGVARDTRGPMSPGPPRPYLYVPMAQNYEPAVELIVATDTDPSRFLATAQEALLQLDPEVVPLEIMTMAEGTDVMLFPVRAGAWAMGAFGLLGLLLSAIGIVGALAYSVAQRGHEVGVRMALGATPERLVRMVVAGGMRKVVAGMAVGLALALAVARLLEGFLVGVSSTDPTVFVLISVLLAAVAGLASYIPARRAAAADPLVVLCRQ
jgi:predicted permease